ncbi:MAG: YebC/PmpR family DNA-binding transcriptional regulator [Candidatus Marinimicrobia bacterium]|nr:YebC/PmpR family DNA-binding transcriptional regulator [Candidatus Neomarinimicrobiota bacterium]
MAGHSKWANIKRRKQAQDAKKGKLFGKLVKEIQVAAKLGGGDPETNLRLRSAIDKAKDNDMPKDNIERAIKKGTGELEGVDYVEQTYEGYGPGGVAIWIKTLTDNTNRTVSEIRHLLESYGGNLGSDGSVTWMFERQGKIIIDSSKSPEDEAFLIASDAGAEDFSNEGDYYEVTTAPKEVHSVKDNIEDSAIPVKEANIDMVPQNIVKIDDPEVAEKILELMDELEEHDDTQDISANFDIEDEVLAQLSDND